MGRVAGCGVGSHTHLATLAIRLVEYMDTPPGVHCLGYRMVTQGNHSLSRALLFMMGELFFLALYSIIIYIGVSFSGTRFPIISFFDFKLRIVLSLFLTSVIVLLSPADSERRYRLIVLGEKEDKW